MALKLSGMAAKNFALFVYAVLKDQKKTHGKTRLCGCSRNSARSNSLMSPPKT